MKCKKNDATFNFPQFQLLAAAMVDPLAESLERVAYGENGRSRLRVIFDNAEDLNLESKNDPDFPLTVLCFHIALVLMRIAAEGFPLPPYKI